MNIIYIAYSCNPYNGSEDKIGWNIPIESAKINDKIYVITKMEHKNKIEKELKKIKLENIKFYFIDIPNIYIKVFRGMLYAGRLNIWNKRAIKKVKEICRNEKIDIIHQITPVEFRAMGNYGEISGVKFIVGPIGGGEYIPKQFAKYQKGNILVETFRKIVNYYYKTKMIITKKLKKSDCILYANNETKQYINVTGNDIVMTEIGACEKDIVLKKKSEIQCNRKMVFLVAGRLIYRKGHIFLLDTLDKIPSHYEYEVRIVGRGSDLKKIEKKIKASNNLKKHVKVIGRVSFEDMSREYDNADALIMPSIRETTGTVIIEGMSKGIPIIALNKFGASIILNEKVGYLYDGLTLGEITDNLKKILIFCIENTGILMEKGKNAQIEAQKYLFKNKVKYYNNIYRSIIEKS